MVTLSVDQNVWLPGMDSNHELDRILKSRNLLILQSAEVVKSIKITLSVQKVYKNVWSFQPGHPKQAPFNCFLSSTALSSK
jgi:hypothetical protein